MKSNRPYSAKAHKACDPMWGRTGPEYGANKEEGMTKPPHKPKVPSASASMMDGPYGGSKPQS